MLQKNFRTFPENRENWTIKVMNDVIMLAVTKTIENKMKK